MSAPDIHDDEPPLRDIFAIVALHALLTTPHRISEERGFQTPEAFAIAAYDAADAMLARRSKS